MDCGCSTEKIHAVHEYLEQHFPDYVLHDLHAPTELTQAGLPTRHAQHHVVSIRQEGVLTYYAVLRCDFQEYSVEEIEEYLRRSKFAEMVRAKRVAVAHKDEASAL